jgi:hypothetical protein
MFTPSRITAAVVFSAAAAFAVTVVPAAISQENAGPLRTQIAQVDTPLVQVTGADCSQHGWPSYEAKCQFDTRGTGSQARLVRVIALR